MKSVCVAALASMASATAFVVPSSFVGTSVSVQAAPSAMTMAAAKDLVGATAPLGFFDPLGFSKGSQETVNKYRESELKHGRTAMLAVLGYFTQEVFHPLYDGKLSSNPLTAASQVPALGWAQILGFIGLVEFVSQKIKSRPSYVPGDYLGASELADGPADPLWVSYQTRELSNGRLAMVAIAGLVAQNLVTGQAAIEQIQSGNGGFLF